MRFQISLAAVFLLGLSGAAFAQEITTPDAADRDSARKVQALFRKVGGAERIVNADQRTAARYALVREIRRELDTYVQGRLNPKESPERLQSRIRSVLNYQPDPELGDPPLAVLSDLRTGPALVLAYTIPVPPHHDTATIRGYRINGSSFELVAMTGEDFLGYNMFKAVLPAPVPGELWLLAWGQAHTYNGRLVRLRIYAFDGSNFRALWTPDDMLDVEVKFTPSGFDVDHHIRVDPFELHDEYILTPEGVIKTGSRPKQ